MHRTVDPTGCSPRFLFLINGLGLGNATRCHGVMQLLRARGATVQVATSGNGLWYFRHHQDWESLHEFGAFHYGADGGGRLSVAGTLGHGFGHLATLVANGRRLRHLLAQWQPHVVVTDSDYSFLLVRRRGIPVVALNNADQVVALYRRFAPPPAAIRPHFYAVERPDALFHRLLPDRVISPALQPAPAARAGGLHSVGPIVRRGLPCRVRRREVRRVVVLLSGSAFASHIHFTLPHYPVAIDVIGREPPREGPPPPGVVFHGRLADTRPLLQQADLLVVNGGFSAVSEGFWLGVPMVVAPVAGHAEQWVNARLVEHLGVGEMAVENQLEQAMLGALERVEHYRRGYDGLPMPEDGAVQAATLLLELAASP